MNGFCRVVVWAAGIAAGAVAFAQEPDVPPAAEPPPTAAAVIDEPLAPPTPLETPTRRPRRPTFTPSASPTVTATDTATVAPPTTTATRRPPALTATPIPASATPTHWANVIGGGDRRALAPLLLGGGLVLLGLCAGALAAGSRERATRRRARRTLATAMLIELRRLDAVLRRVVALENASSFPSLDHPIMEGALRDLSLFRTETAARVAQFHGALRGIQQEIADYRDNPLRWAGRLGELNQLIKARAAAACRAVPELLKALEKDGGQPPPHLGEPAASSAANPALPPPPFKGGDGDDWTL